MHALVDLLHTAPHQSKQRDSQLSRLLDYAPADYAIWVRHSGGPNPNPNPNPNPRTPGMAAPQNGGPPEWRAVADYAVLNLYNTNSYQQTSQV